MDVSQKARTDRFAAAVRAGHSLSEALQVGWHHQHHDAVVAAAVEMLESEGSIDMKRLAASAGMSRASLYRYYPDRLELIREIAALGVTEILSRVSESGSAADRIRVVGDYVLTHPAHAAAMLEIAEAASTDALDTVSEMLLGREMLAPWLIGIVSMCASPDLTESEVVRVQRHIEALAELVGE